MANKVTVAALEHVNTVAFFVGFVLVGYGVARWSPPAACVLLGVVLMVVAALPYLRPMRKR